MPDGTPAITEGVHEPYLSLVVTARNDDHGGNLLGRMQAFVGGWIEQASRHSIPSEIVIVEWNPPAEKPRLKDALHWPADFGPCRVRFIEVPPELHRRYAHAEALPLYQMIAKNVGIRRARGRFVVATNIDILFSDELSAFLGGQDLRPGRMYRIDRYDAMSDVPANIGIGEQLDYCRTHLIRINRREGTFGTSPDGGPMLAASDVAAGGSGILFGQGWFPVEGARAEIWRWALDNAELLLPQVAPDSAGLLVDLEPGPGTGSAPLDLEIVTGGGLPVARLSVSSRTRVRLHLRQPFPASLWFRSHGVSTRAGHDPRVLALRAFRFELSTDGARALLPVRGSGRLSSGWRKLQYVIAKLATGGPLVPLLVPVSPRMGQLLRTYVRWGGVTGMVRNGIAHLLGFGRPAPELAESTSPGANPGKADYVDFLHTNACGDFTLMAREHWFDLRGYPEFDLFSMNLDSVLCFAAHYGGAIEEVLPDPMRIYHIEHGSGSGWTPEGQAKLFARIAAKGLSYMHDQEVLDLAARMRRLQAPMIFNHEDWGMAAFELLETSPNARSGADPPPLADAPGSDWSVDSATSRNRGEAVADEYQKSSRFPTAAPES